MNAYVLAEYVVFITLIISIIMAFIKVRFIKVFPYLCGVNKGDNQVWNILIIFVILRNYNIKFAIVILFIYFCNQQKGRILL